jgi:hypothetical protein
MQFIAEVALNNEQKAALTLNPANGHLTIDTTNVDLHGQVWSLKLYETSTGSSQPNAQGAYFFDVTFVNLCTLDTITATSTIPNQDYELGRTGPALLQPQYTQADAQCASSASYGIRFFSGVQEVA